MGYGVRSNILVYIVVVALLCIFFFFFFKQKTAYEMLRSLVGSEMCIRDRSIDGPFASFVPQGAENIIIKAAKFLSLDGKAHILSLIHI